ncbi:Glu-tRNA(Gln) amidotransferase subunit GatD [Candidatus Woesearchaeota archaeon]|nr:Glu-tRNA(Gln) amidotransferase subunit GatD [Candidatus Woesearchaeota archaeon]
MAKPGDKVKVVCKDTEYTGILIDRKSDVTVVKLENGYNIGIENSRITKTEVLQEGKDIEIKFEGKAEKKKGLPKLSILHTGGTIASKVDYRTGAVYSSFRPEDLLGMFPELGDIANFESTLVANMWSDDLRLKHISVLAEAVKKEAEKGVEGVIVGMGTDNLAVAAAGLAFALEKCPIPVIFVGAQRSSDRGSSDAAMNLTCAALFIAKTDFAGVAICMHDQTADERCAILPPCKTKKLHSSRRDAFRAVNDTPIAYVDFKTRKVQMKKSGYARKGGELVVKNRFEEKTALLKIHINMFPEQFLIYKGWKGLVIEGTGLGHTPGQCPNEWCEIHKKIYPAIKEVVDSGCVVVMTTNCIYGRVQMNVYDKGRDLLALGVLSGEDMLAETAHVKLAWLLGNHTPDDAKKLVGQNLRGEINPRIGEDQFIEEDK